MLRPRRILALLTALAVLVPLAVAARPAPAGASAPVQGVHPRGAAPQLGAVEASLWPVVGLAATPSGQGYWAAASDGGVFTFGDAGFHGSAGNVRLAQPIVGIAATPTGRGYWLVAQDGGVFSYGDAPFLGSTGGMELNDAIVGVAATPTGRGYWLVSADGGVFAFGDARFHGSAGAIPLNEPIVAIAADPRGGGYWLAGGDGGVFTFGGASFHGSASDLDLRRPITGMAATDAGDGYWLVGADGGVFTFGAAGFHGTATPPPGRLIGGLTSVPGGDGYWAWETLDSVVAPPLPPASGSGRRVVYSNSRQRVWLVEGGEHVSRSYLVSGRRGVPAPGTYRVFSKSRYSRDASGTLVLEYMVRFAHGRDLAIGFHAIPYSSSGRTIQSERELGQYRSAGCVRQAKADAAVLWDWAPVGTTVVVTP